MNSYCIFTSKIIKKTEIIELCLYLQKKKSEMNKRNRNILIIALLVVSGLMIGGARMLYTTFFTSPFQISDNTYIYIDKDDDMDSVCHKIEEVAHPKSIKALKWLMHKDNYASRIKTGKYVIKPTDNVRYLERRLLLGYQTPVNVTIGSVRTMDRLARNLSRQLMIDSVDIAKALSDTALITQWGYDLQTLPALFIPNTYEVYWNISAEELLNRLWKENQIFWNKERLKKAEDIGLSPIEISTLASIVEEETAVAAEMPIVAGLYINRLKRDMLLQADPTVKFSWGNFTLRRILFKHLEIDSPYNTYKYAGLPPGPIRIPTIKGLESVLNYEHHNYLYMCAKEDFSGTHNFAVTSAQHASNARKYQAALNRRGIK